MRTHAQPVQPHVQQQQQHAASEPRLQLPAKASPAYGIDEAIKLMRTLPVDENVDLVVRVIRGTLESLSVRVSDIVEDATRRQEQLRTKVSEHQAAIVQLERDIEARRHEIGRLEDALAETTTVRERLQLAEAIGSGIGHVVPPAIGSPMPARVGAPTPAAPSVLNKKVDLGQLVSSSRSAAPTPPQTTFRPILRPDIRKSSSTAGFPAVQVPTPAEAALPPMAASEPPGRNDEDDEHDVESKDMLPIVERS